MLTFCLRPERFGEGMWRAAIRGGVIRLLLQRLQVLVEEDLLWKVLNRRSYWLITPLRMTRAGWFSRSVYPALPTLELLGTPGDPVYKGKIDVCVPFEWVGFEELKFAVEALIPRYHLLLRMRIR